MSPRLKTRYLEEVRPALQAEFGHENQQAVPCLTKIVVNMGVGRAKETPKLLELAAKHLAQLSGQKPIITKARRSIAAFKLREGVPIGCKVTLRKDRMWHFFDKLLSLAIPRFRDFRGLSPFAFDGRGNYSLGVAEQAVFPEIDADKLDLSETVGMGITLNISGGSDEQSRFLLTQFGFPFRKDETYKEHAERKQKKRSVARRY